MLISTVTLSLSLDGVMALGPTPTPLPLPWEILTFQRWSSMDMEPFWEKHLIPFHDGLCGEAFSNWKVLGVPPNPRMPCCPPQFQLPLAENSGSPGWPWDLSTGVHYAEPDQQTR